MMFCPKCNNPLNDGDTFCDKCGAKVEDVPAFCIKCGTKLDASALFCPRCGVSVAGTERASPERASPPPETRTWAVNTRPAETHAKLSDNYAWWLIIIPAAMWFSIMLLSAEISRIVCGVLFILMCWLAFKDSQLIESAGLPKVSPFWAVLLQPVYFYKRGNLEGQTMKNFWRSLTAFVALSAVLMFPEFLSDFQPLERRIASAAPQAVDQAMESILDDPAKCTRVELIGKVSNNRYKGTAFFNNGRSLEVDITVNGDSIYVEVENPLLKELQNLFPN